MVVFLATAALSHEVWIEPDTWMPEPNDKIAAQLLNGQEFKGINLSWNDRSIVRAELWTGDAKVPLEGRLGDIPAFAVTSYTDGLLTLLYQSTHSTVTYRDFMKFESFVTEKGFEEVIKSHKARNLPETPISEAYSRFSKALIGSGSGAGADAPRGLELEIVALDNPYTVQPERMMRFEVRYKGEILVGNLVTVFARNSEGEVVSIGQDTDSMGTIGFVPDPGTEYLIDTVIIREPSRALVVETRGAVWESLWASLTFKVPEAQ